MLGDHLLEVVGLRQAQPAHAVEVSLDALGDLPGDGAAGELAQRGVELVVEHGEALVVAVLEDLRLAAHEAFQRGDVASPARIAAGARRRTRATRG